MKTPVRRNFSTEFRVELAQLVVDQSRSVREIAKTLGIGHSTMDIVGNAYAKSARVKISTCNHGASSIKECCASGECIQQLFRLHSIGSKNSRKS
ncbi:transposase [Sessilibacter sp. MAH4]